MTLVNFRMGIKRVNFQEKLDIKLESIGYDNVEKELNESRKISLCRRRICLRNSSKKRS